MAGAHHSDLADPRLCPACGAGEEGALDWRASSVSCGICGASWSSSRVLVPGRNTATPSENRRSIAWSDAEVVDAVRRPLVSYTSSDDAVWQARMLADEPMARPRGLGAATLLSAAVALLVIGAFFAARERAVAAVPDLAGLYAAIGLPVNLRNLEIANVSAYRKVTPAGTTLIVSGDILNRTSGTQPVPAVRIAAGRTEARDFSAPTSMLEPGASTAFHYEMPIRGSTESDVAVRFVGRARTTGDFDPARAGR